MRESVVDGINSYRAYYNIGVIYECSGHLSEARKYYKKCGEYAPALGRLREQSKSFFVSFQIQQAVSVRFYHSLNVVQTRINVHRQAEIVPFVCLLIVFEFHAALAKLIIEISVGAGSGQFFFQ